MTATAPNEPEGAGGVPASTDVTTEPSVPPESDFLKRARENPEWAEQQVKQFQSAADRAEVERKRLAEMVEPIQTLIDSYGAPTIAAAVENYRAIRNSREIGEMIQEFERTGQLAARSASAPNGEDDEYKTPEEQEFESLRAELNRLRSETAANTLASGKQVLMQHMEKVFGEFGFTPEDKEKMRSAMTSQIESWQRMGEAGVAAMKSLMGPNGEKTVRGIMLSDLSPEVLRAAAANTDLRKRQELSGLATDGPSGALSTGKEPPPEFKSALEAARWARANPESHDSQ